MNRGAASNAITSTGREVPYRGLAMCIMLVVAMCRMRVWYNCTMMPLGVGWVLVFLLGLPKAGP